MRTTDSYGSNGDGDLDHAEPEDQARNRRAGKNGNPPPEAHRFPPGRSGNPGGRPPGRSLTALLREILDSGTFGGKALPQGKTVADVLAEVFVREALKGKFPFAKEVLERVD